MKTEHKVFLALFAFIAAAAGAFLLRDIFDPLYTGKIELYVLLVLILLVVPTAGALLFPTKSRVASLGAVALLLVGGFLLHLGYVATPSASVVDSNPVMQQVQKSASRCVEKDSDLRVLKNALEGAGWRGSGGNGNIFMGVPTTRTGKNVMCEGEVWPELPEGWAYNIVKDTDVSDGTFLIGARNREGLNIVCDASGCEMIRLEPETLFTLRF